MHSATKWSRLTFVSPESVNDDGELTPEGQSAVDAVLRRVGDDPDAWSRVVTIAWGRPVVRLTPKRLSADSGEHGTEHPSFSRLGTVVTSLKEVRVLLRACGVTA